MSQGIIHQTQVRVLFVTWEYPPVGAGIGSYVHQMAAALTAAGHHACVVTGRVAGVPERESGESGTLYRIYDRPDIGTAALADRILEICREERIDWIEGADHWGECATLIRRRNRPGVLIKAHSSNALRRLRECQVLFAWQRPLIALALLRARVRTRDEAYCTSHADALAAPSRRILEELRAQGTRLPARSVVIPNPIAIPASWQNREAADPTLLLVGRIDIGKGIQFIPSIIAGLRQEFPRLRVELAGPDTFARGLGSLQAWLRRQCAGFEEHLSFLGRLGREDLDEAYRRAWAVIVPSRWDNFPGALLEAMARQKAVVASPHGGMPEMLAGTTGSIADPQSGQFADKVRELLADGSHRRAVGESVYAKALSHYAPAVVVDAYLRFLGSPP